MKIDIPPAFLLTDCTVCGRLHAPIRRCDPMALRLGNDNG
jgi:hypothetical protein